MNELINIVHQHLGSSKSTSKGNESFYCPFCNHKKRKLEIQLDETNLQFGTWHCWVCDSKGTSIYSLFKALNKSSDFLDTVYTIEKPKHKKNIELPAGIINTLTLPEEFISLSNLKPNISISTQKALTYLSNRNITDIDILRYNIGYCNTGKYKDRIIIPNYNSKNELDYFVARYFGTKPNQINYNTPSVDKSQIIGNENLINWKLPVYLVEGKFDAIAIRYNSIPLFGKTISDKLLEQLILSQPPKITIILDSDAIKNIIKTATILSKKLLNTKIYVVLLKQDDPSKLGYKKIWNIINNESTLFDKQFLIKYKIAKQ